VITPSSSLSAAWVPRLPCLSRITVLCERLFTWGSVLGIRSKLADLVWPGACARRLLTPPDAPTTMYDHVVGNIMVDSVPPISAFLSIQREKHGSKELPDTHLLYVRTSKHTLDVTITSSMQNLRVGLLDSSKPSVARRQKKRDSFTMDIWVPAALLEHALPGLVRSFESRGRSAKTRRTVRQTKKKGSPM